MFTIHHQENTNNTKQDHPIKGTEKKNFIATSYGFAYAFPDADTVPADAATKWQLTLKVLLPPKSF
jgi:hypothetical protein